MIISERSVKDILLILSSWMSALECLKIVIFGLPSQSFVSGTDLLSVARLFGFHVVCTHPIPEGFLKFVIRFLELQ